MGALKLPESLTIDPTRYGPTVAQAVDPGTIPPLADGPPDSRAVAKLMPLTASELAGGGRRPADLDAATACLAGLWLWAGELDTSHQISQKLDTPEGAFWHGIMHRREPDYGNAKYWFRRVGAHPIFPQLSADAATLAGQYSIAPRWVGTPGDWDPFAFVDLCEQAAQQGGELERFCRLVAAREWARLFDYCFAKAFADVTGPLPA